MVNIFSKLWSYLGNLKTKLRTKLKTSFDKHHKRKNTININIQKLAELKKQLEAYYNQKNNYVSNKDFNKVIRTNVIQKPIDIQEINKKIIGLNLDNSEKFNFIDRTDYYIICNKVFSIPPKYLSSKKIEKLLRDYKIKKNIVADDNTNNFITKKIVKIKKINKKQIINHITDSNERGIGKNIIDYNRVILFVYSGCLEHWLKLIENSKLDDYLAKYTDYKPSFDEFAKFKKEFGNFNEVRILNNFDIVSKMINKYINYCCRYSVMKNVDENIVISLAYKESTLFGSRMPKIQEDFHTHIHINKGKIVLLDLSKAFDNINKDFLNSIMKQYLPQYLIDYINFNMFTVTETKSEINNNLGILQGHSLSTTLFHLCHIVICQYIKQQINDIKIRIFVDDIALYYDKTISNDKINEDIKKIDDIYNIFGLTINNKKTITINMNNNLEYKDKLYLGVPISNIYKDVRKCLDEKYGKDFLDNLNTAYVNKKISEYDTYRLELSLAYRLKYLQCFNKESDKLEFENTMKKDNEYLYSIYKKQFKDISDEYYTFI